MAIYSVNYVPGKTKHIFQGILETGSEFKIIFGKDKWYLGPASPVSLWESGKKWSPGQSLTYNGHPEHVDPLSEHSPVPEGLTGIDILGSCSTCHTESLTSGLRAMAVEPSETTLIQPKY